MIMENKNRILIVDDTPSIHDDFKKILCNSVNINNGLDDMAEDLFGGTSQDELYEQLDYEVDSAFQGEEAIRMVEKAEKENRGYSLVFMDVRMPPGLDGIKTISRLWEKHPHLEIVICTAYSDYSWVDIVKMLGPSDHLLVLKKPFDADEAQQMALALSYKSKSSRDKQKMINNLKNNLDLCNQNVVELKAKLDNKDINK